MGLTLLILITTVCTIGSQLILKGGVAAIVDVWRAEGLVPFFWAAATSPRVLLALSIQGAGYFVWFFVIAQAKLSVAFATSGAFFYIIMGLASWAVYGERLNAFQWLGLLLISTGVFLLNIKAG